MATKNLFLQSPDAGDIDAIFSQGVDSLAAAPVYAQGLTPGPAPALRGEVSTGFQSAVDRVLKHEGGYTASDGNTGAPANYGINQKHNPDLDVKNITKDQAVQRYKSNYWDAIGGDKLPAEIQATALDAAVNQGPARANRWLRESGGDPAKFNQLRREHYEMLAEQPEYSRYKKTWLSRLESYENGAPTAGAKPAAKAETQPGLQQKLDQEEPGRYQVLSEDEAVAHQRKSLQSTLDAEEAGRYQVLTDDELTKLPPSASIPGGGITPSTELKAQPDAQQDVGFFGRLPQVAKNGWDNMNRSLDTSRAVLSGDFSPKTLDLLAANIQAQAAQAKMDETRQHASERELKAAIEEFGKTKGWGDSTKGLFSLLGTAATNPKGVAIGTVEQIANMLPSVGGALSGAGAGAGIGAAAGSVIPGAGTAAGAGVGALWGSRAGMAAGTAALEFGNEITEAVTSRLEKQNLPPTRENIAALLADPAMQSEIKTQAATKGLTLAAVDALTMGLAGKVGAKGVQAAAGGAKGTAARYGAGAVGIELAGEPAGEALSQLAARGEVNKADVAAEGIYGAGSSIASAGIGTGGQVIRDRVARAPAAPAPAAPGPMPSPAAPQARQEPTMDVTYTDGQGNTVTEVVPGAPAAPAAPEPSGPIGRAINKATPDQAAPEPAPAQTPPAATAAPDLPRVTITAENGTTMTGVAEQLGEDGSGRVLGDDGQIYQFTPEDGVTITVDEPAQAAPAEAANDNQTSAPVIPQANERPAGDTVPAQVATTEPEGDASPAGNGAGQPVDSGAGQGVAEGVPAANLPADAQPALSDGTRTDSLSRTASWVIREKGTGRVIAETFDKKKVDALNTEKYEAVPVQQHLGELNSAIKAGDAGRDEHTGKWFGSQEKADAYMGKRAIAGTHEVVQTGKVRFEVKPKAEPVVSQELTTASTAPASLAPEAVEAAVPAAPKRKLRDTRGTGVRLHGTSNPLPDGGPTNDGVYSGSVMNIYGQGFYTTDAADIASGYTKKGRGGAPTVYEIKEKSPVKVYDMDEPMSPEIRKIAEDALGDLARDEDGETGKAISTLTEMFDEARAESRGEGISASEVQEMFDSIRDRMEALGYRGLSHVGGKKTGNAAHKVNIYWYPQDDLTVEMGDMARFEEGDGQAETSANAAPDKAQPGPLPKAEGAKRTVAITPAGRDVEVQMRLVEADQLVTSNDASGSVNPAYPAELQPRDRSRASSLIQINELASKLDPRLLGENPSTTDGAPIVSNAGVVESGNGRTLAIRQAYDTNLPSAQAYRQWLDDNGYDTKGMKAPVLVRERVTDMTTQELRDYTRESNERTTADLSKTERAMSDAKAVGPALGLYRGGDVMAAANRDFVRAFMENVVSPADRGGMMDADGMLSQDGRRRIEASLLAAAYGDASIVADIFESSDSDIKAIGGALMEVAGSWARMREEAKAGTIPATMDLTANLMDAVAVVRRARGEGRPVFEFVNQVDFFSGGMAANTVAFLRLFYRGENFTRARGREKLVVALTDYTETARRTEPGPNLFGDAEPTGTDILRNTNDRTQRNEGQPDQQADIFAGQKRDDAGAEPSGGSGQRPAPGPAGEAQGKAGAGRSAEPAAEGVAAAKPAGYGANNKLVSTERANELRAKLKAKLGQLNSGIDPEMLAAGTELAVYHIEAGVRKFSDFARTMADDLGVGMDKVKPYLRSWYNGARDMMEDSGASVDGMDSADVVREELGKITAAQPAEGKNDAPSTTADLERDRQEPATEPDVAGAVQRDGGRAAGADGSADLPAGEGRGQPGATGARSGGSLVDGERGDFAVHRGDGASELADIVTGSEFGGRSGDAGVAGIPPQAVPAEAIAATADSPAKNADKRKAQRDAERVAVKRGDLANIRETLPFLNAGQQEDVHKAEKRFAQTEGYGMLFTNGTGTGKTYVALGLSKRFSRDGKNDILIVVPDTKVATDFVDSARDLGLTINQLPDTKTAGTGIVVTTYANLGENAALAKRDWDLVVADEAHKLMQSADGGVTNALTNLRALTMHPDAAYSRHSLLEADRLAERAGLNAKIKEAQESGNVAAVEKLTAKQAALDTALAKSLEATKEAVAKSQGAARPRAAFLSATPFAYEKTVDWANGYLFDYNEGRGDESRTTRGYNEGSNRDQFMMQHFGYSMRTNKLTEPDGSKIDRGLMQRNFNQWLKSRGALSGRMLEVDADYDRRFASIESAIGNRIDEVFSWLDAQREAAPRGDRAYSLLADAIRKKFDHLSRRQLLEAIKTQEAIPLVKKHLALGRKVVVFHDYKKGGGFNPFEINVSDADGDFYTPAERENFKAALGAFRKEFSDLIRANLQDMPPPVEAFRAALPETLVVNGDEKARDNLARYKKFQDDASGPQVILVQSAKNAGWSGHDTTGKNQRVLLNLGLPTAPTTAIQQEGRIYRTGQVSNAIMRYLNTGTNWEKVAFASTIAGRASTAENLGMGELARGLKDSFIAAFEETDTYEPGHEGEGTGGKERDRAQNNATTPFQRAKTFYWATQKKNSKTKAQEGKDYFATPEPLGFKMVEWADIQGGEQALEPSAGHGAIARWFGENVNATVVEPSSALRARLALAVDMNAARFVASTFEDLAISNKYDAITMNPPFGVGGKTAIEHLDKATRHLRNGGRVVALIPTGPAADKRFDQWLYEQDAKGRSVRSDLHLLADIKLPQVTFERAGTAVATRIVVIDKQGDEALAAKIPATRQRDLSDIEDINTLFDRLEDMDLPARVRDQKAEGQAQPSAPAPRAPGKDAATTPMQAGEELVEHVTTKGKTLRGVVRKDLLKEEAQAIDAYTFRKDGGWFIREKHLSQDAGPRYSVAPGIDQGVDRALRDMLSAEDALAEVRDGDPGRVTLDQWMALSDRSLKAKKALTAEIAKMPDDGFVLQAGASGGRTVILTKSAQQAGKWQLTRFDAKGEPWGDTNYDTKEQAIREFIEEADLSTLANGDGTMGDRYSVAQGIDRSQVLPVPEVSTFDVPAEDLYHTANEWMRENLSGVSVRNESLGSDVNFSKAGRSKSLSVGRRDARRMSVVKALPELVKNGVLIEEQGDRKGRDGVDGYATLVAPASVDGVTYAVLMKVRRATGRDIFYTVEAFSLEKSSNGGVGPLTPTGDAHSANALSGDGDAAAVNKPGAAAAPSPDAKTITVGELLDAINSVNRAFSVSNSPVADNVIQEREEREVITAQSLSRLLRKVTLGSAIDILLSRGSVVLHDTASSVPVKNAPAGMQGVTTEDGKIHLNAAGLTSRTALGVLLHEAFHQGARSLMSDKAWIGLTRRLGTMHKQAEQSTGRTREVMLAAARAVDRENARRDGQMSEALTAEEFGAYLIENYEQMPASFRKWVDDVVGAIKAWLLRRFGIQAGEVTAGQVRALAVAALRDGGRTNRAEPSFSSAETTITPSTVSAEIEAAFPGVRLDLFGRAGTPWTLSRIEVPKGARETGTGTSVMKRLIGAADEAGATVALTPSSDFGGNKKRLVVFYQRFGFVENKGRNRDFEISETMYRLPPDPAHDSNRFSIKDDDARIADMPAASKTALKGFFGKIGKQSLPKTLKAQWDTATERLALRVRQAGVDRYAALLENDNALHGDDTLDGSIASSGWALARMSNAAGGALSAMMNGGRIYLDAKEKVIDVREGTEGFAKMLSRLGTPAEIDRFMGWVAANRARKLLGEGRENLFTAEEIEAAILLSSGKLEGGGSRAMAYSKAWAEFQQYRDDVLAIAEQAGIISPEQRATWMEDFYVPFYRVIDEDNIGGPSSKAGLSRQQAVKKLKGGSQNVNDLLENTLMNFHHLLQASLKNQAAVQALENAEQLGIAEKTTEGNRDKKASTFVNVDGEKVWYNVSDPLTFKALSSISAVGMNNPAMRIGRAFKRFFTSMTTITPQFIVANALRDSLSAMATSPTSGVPFKNALKGAMSYGNSAMRARMLASGAAYSFGHVYGENIDDLKASVTKGMRDAKVLSDPKIIPRTVIGAWRQYQKLQDMSENMNRAGIWENNLEKGKLKAAFEARDLMAFDAHGDAITIRILTDLVPFLNARIQGLDKLYRAGVKPSIKTVFGKGSATDKQAFGRFAAVVGALSLVSIGLFLSNWDDEEYRKLEDWQRDTYWVVRVGQQMFFIPKPFEVGAIATMAERLAEQFTDPTVGGKKFAERLGHMLTDTFAFNPIPQAIKPLYELATNTDTFSNRPIEDVSMERVNPSLRSRPDTSRMSGAVSAGMEKVLGEKALSPVQLDHLVRAYSGQVGATALATADTLWRSAGGEEQAARRWYEYQPIRRFYKNLADEDAYTRYGTDFYNAQKESARAYASLQYLDKLGEADAAMALLKSKETEIGRYKALNRVSSQLSKINAEMKRIQRDKEMSAEDKRVGLDRMRGLRNLITENVGKELENQRTLSAAGAGDASDE